MLRSSHTALGPPTACLATVLALGLTASACGADSGLGRAALDRKANALCSAESKAVGVIAPPSDVTDVTEASPYFDHVEPIVSQTTAQLEALRPARSITSDWDAFLALRNQETTLLKTVRQEADAGDPSGRRDLTKEPALADQVDAAATKAGAASCAE